MSFRVSSSTGRNGGPSVYVLKECKRREWRYHSSCYVTVAVPVILPLIHNLVARTENTANSTFTQIKCFIQNLMVCLCCLTTPNFVYIVIMMDHLFLSKNLYKSCIFTFATLSSHIITKTYPKQKLFILKNFYERWYLWATGSWHFNLCNFAFVIIKMWNGKLIVLCHCMS